MTPLEAWLKNAKWQAQHQVMNNDTAEQAIAVIEKLKEHYAFLLHAAEYIYKPDAPLHKGLSPTFYHTLSYEGDLELIEKTKAAREALAIEPEKL